MPREITEERRKYKREWMARRRQDEEFREQEKKVDSKRKRKTGREDQKSISNETDEENTKKDQDLRHEAHQKSSNKSDEERRKYKREWMARRRQDEEFREQEKKVDSKRKRKTGREDQKSISNETDEENTKKDQDLRHEAHQKSSNKSDEERRKYRREWIAKKRREESFREAERKADAKRKREADAKRKKEIRDQQIQLEPVKKNAEVCPKKVLPDLVRREAKIYAKAQRQRKTKQDPALPQVENKTNADAQRKARRKVAKPEIQKNHKTKGELTEEKLQKLQSIRERNAESIRRKRAQLTEDERIALRAKATEDRRRLRAAMSEEQKKQFKARRIEKINKFKNPNDKTLNETTTERITGLITLTGFHTNKNPNRYQNAASFIKNAFFHIRDMHWEIERLKSSLKSCVATAVKSAVKLHVMQKQTRCQSLTFVEISPPNEPNNFKREFRTEDSDTDPLVDASDLRTEKACPSIENTTDDFTVEDFTVFTHATPPVDKNTVETNITEKISCTICYKKFATNIGLTIHQRAHESNYREFKCCVCSQMFYTCNSMTDHYIEAHTLHLTIDNDEDESEKSEDEIKERSRHEFDFFFSGKCSICFQTFDKTKFGLGFYSRHIINDHSENTELVKFFTYACSGCKKLHTSLRTLQNHWKRECSSLHNQRSEKIVCLDCGMQFSNEKSLSSHVLIFHTLIPQRAICEQCGTEFSRKNTLMKHIREVHQGDYKFPCEDCEEIFQSKQFLRKHIKSVHMAGLRPYRCKICDKTFTAKASLIIHEGVHTGHNCKMCGKTLSTYFDLCRHRQLVHAQSSSAEGETNEDNNNLPHADLVPDCGICGKSYSSFIALASHKRYSHGNSTFVCDVCERPFTSPILLRTHKYSHDNVRRFACSICKNDFRRPSDFYDHRKKEHSNSTERATLVRLIPEERCYAEETKKKMRANSISSFESVKISQTNSEQHPNTLQIQTQALIAPNIDNQIPELLEGTNIIFDKENSPEPDDYFPEMEFDNEANENEVAVPQNLIRELENANLQNALLDTVTSMNEDSTIAKHVVSDNNTEVIHSEQPFKLIDYSRANVPSESAVVTVVNKAENLKKESEHKHKVLIEDEDRDAFIVDMDTLDLGKVKFENPPGDIEEDASSVSNDSVSDGESEFEGVNCKKALTNRVISFPQDPYSPCLVVILRKLLKYKCVPCKKSIFTTSKCEFRRHKRIHALNTAEEKNPKRKRRPKERVEKKKKMKREKVDKVKKPGFECGYCEVKNLTSTKMLAHCKKDHPGQKPFKCKQCPRMYTSIDTYYNHKTNRHNPPKPKIPIDKTKKEIICEICGKAFCTKQQVYVHKAHYHSNKPRDCHICSKSFSSAGNLAIHMDRIHENRVRNHLCQVCGKAFIKAHELKTHEDAVHKKIKRKTKPRVLVKTDKTHPYSCKVCSIQFVKESGLQHHLELHDPKRQYGCDICGWRFKAYNNLFTHKKGYHKIYGPRSKEAKAALAAAKVNDTENDGNGIHPPIDL